MIVVQHPSTPMTHPVPSSFPDWLASARRGESDGYDALYRWLGGPVTRFAVARGAADPEAVTNDTFVGAFRSLERFVGGGDAFRAWVFTIARNRLIDESRLRNRRPMIVSASIPDRVAPDADTPVLDLEGHDRVVRLLDSLTEAQRDVIVLRVIADLSLADTATIVGRPITAVKRLQARALDQLRRTVLAEAETTQTEATQTQAIDTAAAETEEEVS